MGKFIDETGNKYGRLTVLKKQIKEPLTVVLSGYVSVNVAIQLLFSENILIMDTFNHVVV